ncbi:hypothetical protein HNQ86_001706 [Oleiagrimonas soli]|uniref:Uncharacterized protein n=1 Tax=Oleiagrimonas soli TaxID=1543381 RepID=A0A841KNX5_9GAMM|nr:hypothetical protein [Oleiagrimonas soli]
MQAAHMDFVHAPALQRVFAAQRAIHGAPSAES